CGLRMKASPNLCAWVFSNCGRHEDAAAAYQRLLQIRPRWAEGYRHISGSLAAAGQLDRAIFYAGRASELDPHSFEFAVHAASLCETAGRYQDAIGHLTRAAAIAPTVSAVLRQMSGLKFALEEHEGGRICSAAGRVTCAGRSTKCAARRRAL